MSGGNLLGWSPRSAAESCVTLNGLLHLSEPQVPLAQVRTGTISGLRCCPEGLKPHLVWAQPFYQVGRPTLGWCGDLGPVSSGVAQKKKHPKTCSQRPVMGRLTHPTPAGEPRRCIEAEADCWALPASCPGAPEVDGGGALGREGPSPGTGFDFQGLAPELWRL